MNQAPAKANAAGNKDDLFDGSTMTFGEHLEELRKALLRSAIWLAVGLGIGLFFANDVVQFVQEPLGEAITKFMAKQTLYRTGIDPESDRAAVMKQWLIEKGLVYETVFMIDHEAVAASSVGAQPDGKPVEAKATNAALEKSESKIDGADPMIHDPMIPEAVVRDPAGHLKPVTIWRPVEAGLSSFQMEETFMIWLKAGLVVGVVLASPAIFFHIWQFVAAGLYPHERKYVYVYMPFSVVLFISGVGLAFFLVLKYVMQFLLTFNADMNVDLVPRLSNYVSFVLLLPLGFGVAFQLPLVMLFLQRIGLFETQAYVGSWRIAVLVIALLSMILTPADIYSMIALMVPLILLYFLGIGLCKYMPKGRGVGSQGYDPA